MKFREADIQDIDQIMTVRFAVKENILSDPTLVTHQDCQEYMTTRGKAWVCEVEETIVGFSYVDMKDHNVWALFVTPEFAEMGIGRELHRIMLDWYFSVCTEKIWLGTSPGTRAETFYRMQGWTEAGMHGKELKFEMTKEEWSKRSASWSDNTSVKSSDKELD